MSATRVSLDDLWGSAPRAGEVFRPDRLPEIPEAARRYLRHAIAAGTPLAGAVRLRMRGRIKLKGWLPFTAEQVIARGRGMIWRARVRMYGLPIVGRDRLLDGVGALRWRLLGFIPVMTASGPDIARSAAGRLAAESVWLPSVLCGRDVSWSGDAAHARARFEVQGHAIELGLTVDDRGRLESMDLERWGDPDGAGFRLESFGALVEEEATFDGYTIPSRLRVGWHFGTDRFEPEGEFFRAAVEEATYR